MLTTGGGVLPGPDSVLPDLQPWGRKSIQKSILVDFKLSTKLSHLQLQWIYSRMVPTKIYCFPCKKICGKYSRPCIPLSSPKETVKIPSSSLNLYRDIQIYLTASHW